MSLHRTASRSTDSTTHTGPLPGTAMPDIQLRLTLDELNLILEGVGNLPFARVYALVGKIQAQAAEQLQAAQAGGSGPAAPNVTPMAVAKG
jgi:hypothetical protein